MRYLLEPIGVIRSELISREAAPRQGFHGAPDAVIDIKAEFAPGLKGLAAGDEIMVLTWLHEGRRGTLLVHPRRKDDLPDTGVFTTRSPDRPNPIGLHRVTVREIIGTRLKVGPLEAIDDTPVIDMKPVIADQDGR